MASSREDSPAHRSLPLFPAPISPLSVSFTPAGGHPLLYFINLPVTAFYSLAPGPLRARPSGFLPIARFLSILLADPPFPPLQCYCLLALLGEERVVPPPLGVRVPTLQYVDLFGNPQQLVN
jgi:hypothetical protein